MQLFNKTSLPNAITNWLGLVLIRFAVFQDTHPISLLHYFVTPIGGDTSYVILRQDANLYVLVTTDHPDPLYHCNELKKLSEKYTFSKLVSPDGESLDLANLSEDNFFTKEAATYYYCALAESL